MGQCGSKTHRRSITKQEEEQVTSERLHEYFGATIDVETDAPVGAETAATDAPATLAAVTEEAAQSHPPKHNYAALLGTGLTPTGTNLRLSHGALTSDDTIHQRAELEAAAHMIETMGAAG